MEIFLKIKKLDDYYIITSNVFISFEEADIPLNKFIADNSCAREFVFINRAGYLYIFQDQVSGNNIENIIEIIEKYKKVFNIALQLFRNKRDE